MKKLVGLLTLLLVYHFSPAQRISAADEKFLQLREDSMKTLAVTIIRGRNSEDRLKADSSFTRLLMRALKTKYSFYYSFDSLATISMLYAPDSSFKIFTWQLMINDNVIRHHGVIQRRTPDGSLIRFPLIDKSIITTNLKDTVTNHLAWIGAIYYRIIHKKVYERNYYTFLGFDKNNIRSDRKIIEVMTFENNEPVFGGRYFSFEDDALAPKTASSRYIMEYKKDAGPRLSYDADLDMIIAEHLVSESGEPNKKWTLIGDGDYEGFKWTNGRWMHVNKVFNYVTPQGKEPVPKPLRDNSGNFIDNKTEEGKPVTKPKKNGKE